MNLTAEDIINKCLDCDNYFLLRNVLNLHCLDYGDESLLFESISDELDKMEKDGQFKPTNVEFAFPHFNPIIDNPHNYSGEIFEKVELIGKDERLSAIRRWRKEVYDVGIRTEHKRKKKLRLAGVKTFRWKLSDAALSQFLDELIINKFIRKPLKETFFALFGNVPALEVKGRIMWLPTYKGNPSKSVLLKMFDQMEKHEMIVGKESNKNKLIEAFFFDVTGNPLQLIKQSKSNLTSHNSELDQKVESILRYVRSYSPQV